MNEHIAVPHSLVKDLLAALQGHRDDLRFQLASLSAPQPPAEAHCATCSCVSGMTPAIRFDATPAEKEGAVRDLLVRMGWTPPPEAQPPSAPVGVVEALSELVDLMQGVIDGEYKPDSFTLQPARAALAQQPAATLPDVDDDDLTVAYMAGRHDGRKEAQQPAAMDGAMVERIAALLHEEATDEPWAVAGVEHDGPDRDYYRTLARKVIDRADQQPAAFECPHRTRCDCLGACKYGYAGNGALAQQPAAVDGASVVVPRWFMEKLAKDTRDIGMFEMSAAIRRVALSDQQPGGES